MVAMTMTLEEYSQSGSSVTFIQPASHTLAKPRLGIRKRKAASKLGEVTDLSMKFLTSTVDSAGLPIASKVSAEVIFRVPFDALAADITNIRSDIRDFVANDEFGDFIANGTFTV